MDTRFNNLPTVRLKLFFDQMSAAPSRPAWSGLKDGKVPGADRGSGECRGRADSALSAIGREVGRPLCWLAQTLLKPVTGSRASEGLFCPGSPWQAAGGRPFSPAVLQVEQTNCDTP